MATHKPAAGKTTINAQLPISMKQEIIARADKQGTTASQILRELVEKSLEAA